MKRFAVLFLSIFVILSACAQGGEETNSATSEGHSEPVQEPDRDLVAEGLPAFNEEVASLPETTLDVWLATDYAEEAPIQDVIAEFSEVYPHIKVNTRGIEWGEMINQIRTRSHWGIAAGYGTSTRFCDGGSRVGGTC